MKNILNFKSVTIALLSVFIFLFATTTTNAQSKETEKIFVKIDVDGLSCPFCAYGLEKKLKKIETVSNIEIYLEKGIAVFSVAKDKKPTKEILEKIVTEAGFTPNGIAFSEHAFKIKEDE